MHDYQQIVNDIRGSLSLGDHDNVDFLRATAADYLVLCDQANQRLLNCAALLKRGETSEALRLCELEPNLLDLVAALDFPEREQWVELLARHGMVGPLPLALEVASDLNEAYSMARPMEGVLKRHRLLAMARAPLKMRIPVLRRLAEADSMNSFWREDLATFERERHKELQTEVATAVRTKDATALAALDQELAEQPWEAAPPQALFRRVSEALDQKCQEQTQGELENIESDLSTAFGNGDIEWGRQLRDRWNSTLEESGVQPEAELLARVEPALLWLSEQDAEEELENARLAAVSALERGLVHDYPRDKLEPLYAAATRRGWEIAPPLLRRYESRLAELKRAAALKFWLFASGGVLTLLLIAAGIGWTIHLRAAFQREVSQQLAILDGLIEQKQYAEAQAKLKILSRDSPAVAATEQVQAIAAEVALWQREEERRRIFATTLESVARDATEQLDAELLNPVGELAKTPEEQKALETKQQYIRSLQAQGREKRDREVREAVEAKTAEFTRLKANPTQRPEHLAQMDELRREIEGLNTDGASASVVSDVQKLAKEVKSYSASFQELLDQEKLADHIARDMGQVPEFAARLQKYVTQHGSAQRSADFQVVLGELPLLSLVEQRNSVIEKHKAFTDNPSPRAAAADAELLRDFLKHSGQGPDGDRFRRGLAYAEAIARREDNGSRIEDSLLDLFREPLVARCWLIEHNDGRRFYFLKDPNLPNTDGETSRDYVRDFSLAEKRVKLTRAQVQQGAAPQNSLAKSVAGLLEYAQKNDKNWESQFANILKLIREEQPTMDPLLRLNLLRQTLQVACRGGYCLEMSFANDLKKLEESGIDPAVNWLDPEDPEVQKLRSNAREGLLRLAMHKTASDKAGQIWRDCQQPLGKTYRWIGWLRRKLDGGWTCDMKSVTNEHGELFVMRRDSSGNQQLVLHKIGNIENGVVSIKSTDKQLLVEGRPVLLAP